MQCPLPIECPALENVLNATAVNNVIANFMQLFSDHTYIGWTSTVGALITIVMETALWFIHVPCTSTLDVVAGDLPQ